MKHTHKMKHTHTNQNTHKQIDNYENGRKTRDSQYINADCVNLYHFEIFHSRKQMKFYLISKSSYSNYESSKPSDSTFGPTKKSINSAIKTSTTGTTTTTIFNPPDTSKQYFKQRRELKRRVRQIIHRYLKRAFIQRED